MKRLRPDQIRGIESELERAELPAPLWRQVRRLLDHIDAMAADEALLTGGDADPASGALFHFEQEPTTPADAEAYRREVAERPGSPRRTSSEQIKSDAGPNKNNRTD